MAGGASLIFNAITIKGSPIYVRTCTEIPLDRVGRSSGTMPTRCTCGLSCKTCLWDGTRDDEKRTTSGPNRRSCTCRWLRNGCVVWRVPNARDPPDHINGREKRIGKLPVDGWCSQTNTAYQFHVVTTMVTRETRKNTAYLRYCVKVIELW